MKNYAIASLALAASLAITPFAFAESFGYKASDTSVIASPAFDRGHTGIANRTGVSASYKGNNGTPATFGPTASEVFNTGYDANSLLLSRDGGFLLDNLLYPGDSGNGMQDRDDVLVDISGYQLSLFSGAVGGINAQGSGHFYFADNGSYHANKETPKGKIELVGSRVTLTEAPEPGSLFLLGTGLLCMALVLFRRAAKRSTGS
ncbi:MAG TPA: PEP-CTERM sorting domain-containing protein [Terracidiphilus sp.]|nr:PEP-CTERM sorting domain-containing protein [Terracidiphilus sp.]